MQAIRKNRPSPLRRRSGSVLCDPEAMGRAEGPLAGFQHHVADIRTR